MMDIQRIRNAVEHRAYRFINKYRGWKTDRKIIVIESDDWGSIRMPNRDVYEKTLMKGIRVDKCAYCKYDTLATDHDFEALYQVLEKHEDSQGRPPVITANTIVANPDFKKIKDNNFQEYYFELFTDTLKRYPNRSFDMWQQGINSGLFFPQLHGREHLNVERWLKALRNDSRELRFAFDNGYFGISKTISTENNLSLMAALDFDDSQFAHQGNAAVAEAADIFNEIFGFYSKSFIGPNYFWSSDTERALIEKNVMYFQGGFAQKLSNGKQVHHYMGEKNSNNQIYLTRNVIFEPSSLINKDWKSSALRDIKRAFSMKSPAIICTHRVNFIGAIFEENRTKNLKIFDELLYSITKLWPEVEFMTSAQLGGLIESHSCESIG